MISMRKLARLAGVSTATVSRALHDDPRVRPETRERIQALADQHQYLRNMLTQGVLTGRTRLIGLMLPSFDNTTYAAFLEGVLEEARAHGYHVNVAEGHDTIEQLREIIDRFIELRSEGIICRPGIHAPLPRDLLLKAASNGTTFVGVDLHDMHSPVDHVCCDEDLCAEVVLEYLVGLGHRTIAFVGVVGKNRDRGRAHSFRVAMRNHKIATDLIVEAPSGMLPPTCALAILSELFSLPTPPTAIIGWDDFVSCPLVQQAHALGIAVPRRLSIIGVGNMTVAEVTSPPLTTLEVHADERGRAAVRLIVTGDHLQTGEEPSSYRRISFPPRLIKRGSCAPPHFAQC
ncbi:MAG TPA: LacI family DNA-binding transcriptional regulator [Armatimonadota bacterium]|nr:LacI family DNA-binding transcriptional regulator [Armatimonadota bacterium]